MKPAYNKHGIKIAYTTHGDERTMQRGPASLTWDQLAQIIMMNDYTRDNMIIQDNTMNKTIILSPGLHETNCWVVRTILNDKTLKQAKLEWERDWHHDGRRFIEYNGSLPTLDEIPTFTPSTITWDRKRSNTKNQRIQFSYYKGQLDWRNPELAKRTLERLEDPKISDFSKKQFKAKLQESKKRFGGNTMSIEAFLKEMMKGR